MADVGSKFTLIDAARSNGKQAVLAADSFALTQSGLQGTVNAHTEAIETITGSVHQLEQQVKAIARVMASQNVQKLSDTMKLAQDDLKRSISHQISEKQKELMDMVEREVAEVSDTKSTVLKKVDAVEAHIMQVLTQKLDEAAQLRFASVSEMDKLKESLDNIPSIADKTSGVIKGLENKLLDLKAEFREFIVEHEAQNRQQDKATQVLQNEVRTSLDQAREKIDSETKNLSKTMHKRETLVKDEMREVKEQIDKEGAARVEALKMVALQIRDEVHKVRAESENRCTSIEGSMDHKVRPCMSALREMRRAIDEEAVHRDAADKDLARRIAKEIQERHIDEERLVGLIQTCQEAVTKLKNHS